MKRGLRGTLSFIKKEPMAVAAFAAAIASLFITPPDKALLTAIDWKTLATLFMLLSVLDGFKNENLFRPIIRVVGSIHSQIGVSFFLVFGVFFSSMFVTNDVSLIIFVPLTILLFREYGKEHYILPILTMENIAAIRGSLLTPFGSPQNLFLFSNSGMDTGSFLWMMLPLWLGSILLIALFLLFIYRRDLKQPATDTGYEPEAWKPEGKVRRIVYLLLFSLIIACIVTRTAYWPYVTVLVTGVLLVVDRKVFLRVDYVLLFTFLCFFIFSSSIAANEKIAQFLKGAVSGNEYWWSIGISQIISNVPAAIVLWPFTADLKALIYGLDTAGLVFVIGSLASVINLRLYTREYPGQGKKFLLVFEKISLCFFAIVVLLQWLLLI